MGNHMLQRVTNGCGEHKLGLVQLLAFLQLVLALFGSLLCVLTGEGSFQRNTDNQRGDGSGSKT